MKTIQRLLVAIGTVVGIIVLSRLFDSSDGESIASKIEVYKSIRKYQEILYKEDPKQEPTSTLNISRDNNGEYVKQAQPNSLVNPGNLTLSDKRRETTNNLTNVKVRGSRVNALEIGNEKLVGRQVADTKDQIVPHVKEEVDCQALLSVLRHGRKTRRCHYMNEALRLCVNTSNVGSVPLDNFYVHKNTTIPGVYAPYRTANIGFVHLPKSGGTSVENLLKRVKVRGKKIRKSPIWHCGSLFSQAKLGRIKTGRNLYFSKRSYGMHDFAYPGRSFAYVTWFREPISRIVSTYYYLKKTRCGGAHTICMKYVLPSKSLTDFLQKTRKIRYQDFDNFSVRLLQFGDYPDVDDTFEDCCGSAPLYRANQIPVIEEKHYLVAKRNLEKMAFVGLTEDFKTSQDMVSHIFGLPLQKKEVHSNANPHTTQITEWELKILTERNKWDLKLYEDAKRIYEEQKNNYLRMLPHRK